MRRRWRQQQQESCGAAALMVALAELRAQALNTDRELGLWELIRAAGDYQGSLPGRIACRAADEGVDAAIFVDDEGLENAKRLLGSRALFDVPSLLAEHRRAIDEAAAAGIPVHRAPTDPLVLIQQLQRGSRLMLAFALAADAGVVLHWRLYRLEDGVIWEMDPADGQDTPLTENQFLARLPNYIGVGVSLTPRLTPPPLRKA